jgi:hypothetical protein
VLKGVDYLFSFAVGWKKSILGNEIFEAGFNNPRSFIGTSDLSQVRYVFVKSLCTHAQGARLVSQGQLE